MRKTITRVFSIILCAGMMFLSACSTQTNDETRKESASSEINTEQGYVTVSFNSNGGTEVENSKIPKGNTLTLPEDPVKAGYVFCGWNTNPDAEAWVDTIDFSMYKIDTDITLYAIWGSEDYDLDEDGLSHKEEIANSTDPGVYDTDKDGISDGDEVNKYHTEPSNNDTDGDTLLDGFEAAVGLDPLEKKSDGKTNDADRSISYTFSETDDGYSLTVDGNTKMLSSISTSTFDKSIADNTENIISDIISIEKNSSDSFESADLVYSYKNDSLGSISEDDLTILYLNGDTGEYESVPSVIDKVNKTISAKLSHFSKYTVGSASLTNSSFSLPTRNITYDGETINAVEVADSGFDLFTHSFAFHNFITNDCPGGFCGGFSAVAYLNYVEKMPVSGDSFSKNTHSGLNFKKVTIPGYNISSSSRFTENSIYIPDEQNLFNDANDYNADNANLTDSAKEAVECIEHWWAKEQHSFVNRFISPDLADKESKIFTKMLKTRLQSGEPVPIQLYEGKFGLNHIHSVLAYKMYETNDADYILVYDSNFPGEERYIKIFKFFSIVTGAEYKIETVNRLYNYSSIKMAYVTIPDGPYVSHKSSNESSNEVMYAAYLEEVKALINKYGIGKIADDTSGNSAYKMTGLCYARLIDFDNDGNEELLCVYGPTTDGTGYEKSCYMKVFGYDGSNVNTLFESSAFYFGESRTDRGYRIAYCEDNGQTLLLTRKNPMTFVINEWGRLSGNSFETVKSISDYNEADPGNIKYTVDNKEVSKADFDKQLSEWTDKQNYVLFNSDSRDSLESNITETTETLKTLGYVHDAAEVKNAEDLINSQVKDIAELMGSSIETTDDPFSFGSNYFYNDNAFPGMKFFVNITDYNSDFISDIKNNSVTLMGIQVEGGGAGFKHGDTLVTADMNYSQLSEILGTFKCKRSLGYIVNGVFEGIGTKFETDKCTVEINFDINWDISKYLSDDIEVPESEMREHNPKIKNIIVKKI